MSDTRMAWYLAGADLIEEDINKNVAVKIPTHLGYGPLKASEGAPSGARPYCIRRYEEFMVGMSYQNKYYEPETDYSGVVTQPTGQIWTGPPDADERGERSWNIRRLRNYEVVGPVVSIVSKYVWKQEKSFVTLEVPEKYDALSINSNKTVFVNVATNGRRWLVRHKMWRKEKSWQRAS